MIPIILKLKRANQKNIALAQDLILQATYEIFKDAVFHGGTCIWRCYSGNRFSEDIDMYIKKDKEKLNELFELFERKGFIIEKKKVSENGIYSSLNLKGYSVRFEAIFKNIEGSLKEYETAEGNLLNTYALIPEELIKEKIKAYLNRLKMRDLYDIFFLLRYVNNVVEIRKSLKELILRFNEPIDEKDLGGIIIEGLVPNKDKILDYIKGRIKNG